MKFIIKTISIVLLLIQSVETYSQNEFVLDEVIATIGDQIATKSELESKYAGYIAQGMRVNDNSKCEILEDILYSKMLMNQAKLDSIIVTSAQIEGEIDRRIRYLIGQIGSEAALVEYYKKPVSQIKEEQRGPLREQLTVQTMQAEITSGIKVTPEEVKAYFEEIPKDSLPLINSEVELAQIVINAKTSNAALKEVRVKLNEYKRRVEEGENFSTLAVLYSEDKGSALKGGEIGFVGKAEVEPEFGAASFKLKTGNVSSIVKTRYGYHIIQLIERRGNKVNVRHILIKPKQDEAAYEKARTTLDSISTLIKNKEITFSDAAKRFSEDEDTQKGGGVIVNPASNSSMLPMDELDPALFLTIDNMEIGSISEPILKTNPRKKPGYKIVKLQNRTEPHRASLEKDYQRIKTAATAEKEQRVLQDWMKEAITRTYIKLDPKYTTNCEFRQEWVENSEN